MTFSIFPRMVCKTHSKISGGIVVQEQLGQYTLHVQNLIQSGGIVKGIWRRALKNVNLQVEVRKALMLGLGGGTVVQLIKARWRQAKIISVEIDPEIIKVGKKYFGLGKMFGLQIVNADAFDYIRRAKQKFDLIIVDLYLGAKFPPQAEEDKFLVKIKKLLNQNGVAIFNRLRSDETENFEKKLKKYFSFVKKVKTSTNLFFLVKV